jgi:hypothetical protein
MERGLRVMSLVVVSSPRKDLTTVQLLLPQPCVVFVNRRCLLFLVCFLTFVVSCRAFYILLSILIASSQRLETLNIFIFIYFIHETTPSIPKGYAAYEIQRKSASSRPSVGLLQHKRSSVLGSALCAGLGVRAPLIKER